MRADYRSVSDFFYVGFRNEKSHGKDFRYTSRQKEKAKQKAAFLMHRLINVILLPYLLEIHLGYYVNIFITADLEMFLVLTNEGKEFLQEKLDEDIDIGNDRFLWDLLEDHLCSGLELVSSDYCGLTSCNLILTHSSWGLQMTHPRDYDYRERPDQELLGMDSERLETREMVVGDYIWHDPYYAIRSQVKDLFNDGIIELELHTF